MGSRPSASNPNLVSDPSLGCGNEKFGGCGVGRVGRVGRVESCDQAHPISKLGGNRYRWRTKADVRMNRINDMRHKLRSASSLLSSCFESGRIISRSPTLVARTCLCNIY